MLQNYDFHTHSVYDDGKNTPEEMILSAISRGFSAIGLSGHAYTDNCGWCMSRAGTDRFISEINALKIKYDGKIKVMLGTEYDLFSSCSLSPYDYAIGSVHYIETAHGRFPVDSSRELLSETVNRYFSGDIYAYCEKYYSEIALFAECPEINIIGHFDLVEKFNENGVLFDSDNVRYRTAALGALRTLCSAGKIFEINTGAMFRCNRSVPYPAEFLLAELSGLGGRVVLSSDAHTAEAIGYNFDIASALAYKYGFPDHVAL